MYAKYWCSVVLLACLGSGAFAYPLPLSGTEDIPRLIAASALVCKGDVVEAPTPIFVPSSAGMTRLTATANVRPDRCFKGAPQGSSIPVLFDGFVSGVDPSFVLRKGDYLLFFLKPQNGAFAVVDKWFGALPVSRELGPAPEGADGMYLLELDLKAGLRDSNPERVLDSIRMLGNMKHLRSTAELTQLLDAPDLLVRTYVWQALLRLTDYSVLPAVSKFFDTQPEAPHELFLPRDRLFKMQYELTREIEAIRDPNTLHFLERFAVSGKAYSMRMGALDALRAIGSLQSAATFLKALDDPNPDNAFSAMQGLLSLAGGGAIDWVPTWKRFDEAPQFYAAKCREWWQAEGQSKAASRATVQPF
jgi:HEAT repeat protein